MVALGGKLQKASVAAHHVSSPTMTPSGLSIGTMRKSMLRRRASACAQRSQRMNGKCGSFSEPELSCAGSMLREYGSLGMCRGMVESDPNCVTMVDPILRGGTAGACNDEAETRRGAAKQQTART